MADFAGRGSSQMTRRNHFFLLGAALALLVTTNALGAGAELTARYCAQSAANSGEQPIPAELAPYAAKMFDIDLELAKASSFYRCVDGGLLLCTVGANLPCGKANTSRSIAGASNFCRQNPDSIGVPMAATGHNTIYSWRCVGKIAKAGGPVARLDKQGYFASYWKKL
jgi:hypothetical protein